jgi:hypothetical protein
LRNKSESALSLNVALSAFQAFGCVSKMR